MFQKSEIWDVCEHCGIEFEGIIPSCKCYGLSQKELFVLKEQERKRRVERSRVAKDKGIS